MKFSNSLEVKNLVIQVLGAQVCAQLIHNMDSQSDSGPWGGYGWLRVLNLIVKGEFDIRCLISETFDWESSFEGNEYWIHQDVKWRRYIKFHNHD